MDNKEIEQLRTQLDDLDEKLVALLNERANLALTIAVQKQDENLPRYDPEREAQIFAHIQDVSSGPLIGAPLHEIYETILRVMKEL
ncbi:MAG: chorismate mutase [Actinomycetia bacterium]|nr:chorismate mutase [Actinomycetes bacterium]